MIKGGWDLANYAAFQSHPEWYIKAAPKQLSAPGENPDALHPVTLRTPNPLHSLSDLHVLGRLEVPRLGMSVLVVQGADDRKLGLAAGHLTGTAGLGEKGNAVVAGHRDTSFWPIRNVRIGDHIRVRAAKTYDYVVNSVRIVSPEDVSVLRSTDNRTLTLVTCYPFRYFGAAPKRFIVQASIPRS